MSTGKWSRGIFFLPSRIWACSFLWVKTSTRWSVIRTASLMLRVRREVREHLAHVVIEIFDVLIGVVGVMYRLPRRAKSDSCCRRQKTGQSLSLLVVVDGSGRSARSTPAPEPTPKPVIEGVGHLLVADFHDRLLISISFSCVGAGLTFPHPPPEQNEAA
jgi:hypothetical protein